MNVPPDDRRPGLPPPRFGLAFLMLAMTLCGLIFAVVHYVGMTWSVLVVFLLLCVLAHVAGNAMGTRLRDIGSQPVAGSERSFARAAPRDFAPDSKLREKRSLGKPIVVITVCGAALSGILGGLGLAWLTDGRSTWTVHAMGIGACVVLGTIWTFAAVSFVQVTFGAWYHALRESRKR
jgi:hypothetical protein